MRALRRLGAVLLGAGLLCSCHEIDDERIPRMPVSINITGAGMWNTYGVAGTGLYREFILQEWLPYGFPYTQGSATGFGGVLLIGGMDPFTSEPNVPLAYDLSCPVECKRDIRVFIDESNLDAVCPVCQSHYNVVTGGGSPLSGPALTGATKYGLRRYQCLAGAGGGYYLTD